MLLKLLRKEAAVSAGVPDDLAERTVALLVIEAGATDGGAEPLAVAPGSVVLLGAGSDLGLYGAGDGRFSLLAEGSANGALRPVMRGSVVGILKKFGE